MTCELTQLDGSYVLGALAPAERQEFERHLSGCAECALAVRQLAGLPGLLGRVDPVTLESPPDEVPATLLPGLVHEVRRSRLRRLLVSGGLAAAAAVIVAVGVLVSVGLGGDGSPGTGDPPSVSAAAGQTMEPVGPGSMAGRLDLVSVPWGTRIDLTCSYPAVVYRDEVAPPTTYALVVRTRDGRTEQVATWRALPGRTMRLAAATSAARADIASVEVRTADGVPVLRLDS